MVGRARAASGIARAASDTNIPRKTPVYSVIKVTRNVSQPIIYGI